MHHNKLGRTGLFVSELCLGTMTFGGDTGMWGQIGKLGQEDADRLIGRAMDAGINFLDTADVYAEGRSEIMTGQALRNLKVPRDDVVVATKVFGSTGSGSNGRGNSRLHILEGVKASLKRMQLDHIDLYQLHGFDPATPMEETLRALDTLVQHGHVRYVGVSNWAAWQIAKALGISERLALPRFASLQAYYTLAGRELEREITPMLASEEVGLMVWSPLAGGLLSGKYARDAQGPEGSRRATFDFPPVDKPRAFDCIDAMRPMAERRGVSVAQSRSGLAAAPDGCDERHHRRQADRAARRQRRRHAGGPHRRGTGRTRWSQRPGPGISRLDVGAAGRGTRQTARASRAAASVARREGHEPVGHRLDEAAFERPVGAGEDQRSDQHEGAAKGCLPRSSRAPHERAAVRGQATDPVAEAEKRGGGADGEGTHRRHRERQRPAARCEREGGADRRADARRPGEGQHDAGGELAEETGGRQPLPKAFRQGGERSQELFGAGVE